MLFNPFKEKLYLPTVAIQIGYCLRGNGEVIGKKVEGFTGLDVVVFDTLYRADNRLLNGPQSKRQFDRIGFL